MPSSTSCRLWLFLCLAVTCANSALATKGATCYVPDSETKSWNQLSKDEQDAAEVLGWCKKSWDCEGDKCEVPTSEEKDFDELSKDEKSAATTLGWDEKSWDCVADEAKSDMLMVYEKDGKSCGIPAIMLTHWDLLSKEEKGAAEELGWTKDVWEDSFTCYKGQCKWPASDFEAWDELSKKEKDAATTLGWTRDAWSCKEATESKEKGKDKDEDDEDDEDRKGKKFSSPSLRKAAARAARNSSALTAVGAVFMLLLIAGAATAFIRLRSLPPSEDEAAHLTAAEE